MRGTLSCRSILKEETYTVKWTIDNFSALRQKRTVISGPVFAVGHDMVTTWQLYLHLFDSESKKDGSSLTGYGVCLNSVENGALNYLTANFRVAILTEDGKWLYRHRQPKELDGLYKHSRDLNIQDRELSSLLVNNALIIMCMIDLLHSKSVLEQPVVVAPSCVTLENNSNLISNFREMFLSQKFCDFTLKVSGEDIAVHKCILAARSPVFAAMLQHDTQESRFDLAIIKDIPVAVMKLLLMYMYTGHLDPNTNTDLFPDLYLAANRYQLDDLKRYCSQFLSGHLDVDNACQVYQRACLQNDKDLMRSTEHFIVQNWISVLQSKGWEYILNTDASLASEILKTIAETKKG